jgi:hypothetical protein
MTKRFLIILLVCWQGLTALEWQANAGANRHALPQFSFLTGENSFGFPEIQEVNDQWLLKTASGNQVPADVLEWDEEDALRNHAEPGDAASQDILSSTLFAPYTDPGCTAVSRDIHKPPPETLG